MRKPLLFCHVIYTDTFSSRLITSGLAKHTHIHQFHTFEIGFVNPQRLVTLIVRLIRPAAAVESGVYGQRSSQRGVQSRRAI